MTAAQAKFTIETAAQRLARPISDVESAAREVLNMRSVIMLTGEDIERLVTHFSEKEQSKGGGSQRRKLTAKARSSGSRPAGPRRSQYNIEYRKKRGRSRKDRDDAPVELAKSPPPPIVAAKAGVDGKPGAAAVPGVNQKEIDTKRAEQDKILEAISGLNKPKEAEAEAEIKPEAQEGAPPAAEQAAAPAARQAAADGNGGKAAEAERPQERPKGKRKKDRRTLSVGRTSLEERKTKLRRRRALKSAPMRQEFQMPEGTQIKEVEIPERISVRDLAAAMSIKQEIVAEKIEALGEDYEDVEDLDQETASLIVEDFGHVPVLTGDKDSEYISNIKDAVGSDIVTRHPVVTVMGHVDHGKTSLLDYIRKTQVTETESGGITQHIGAYRVDSPGGAITFIDTPGHEVFTEMRARGANVTDIVVLVVAADDGVQPQTKEAIDHAKAAAVPIVVAVNKIDLVGDRTEEIMKQLAAEGLQPEDWGGDVQVVPVSAATGQGIDDLLSAVLLTAELHEEDLKASLDVDAHGSIIEIKTEKGLGTILTGIVRQGVLRKGQFLLCDTACGKVKALRNEHGELVDEAGPSTPVQIQGISDQPRVGSEFYVADSEAKAREHAEERQHRMRQQELADSATSVDADSFEEHLELLEREKQRKVMHVIVKADVAGTCEALVQQLSGIGNDEAEVNVISSGVGAITDSDVILADASKATLIAFRVTAPGKTRKLIKDKKLQLVSGDVFYKITDHVKAELEGMLPPVVEELVRGKALVKEVFSIHKVGRIAGCGVVDGKIEDRLPVRVVRDGTVVYKTKISELRHHKDKVRSISSGSDCGIHLEKFSDFKPGDEIESIEEISSRQTL